MTHTDTIRQCRAFADAFPEPNILRGIALAEAGTLSWGQIYNLFHKCAAAMVAAGHRIPEGGWKPAV